MSTTSDNFVHSFEGIDGAAYLGAIAKRAYRLQPGGRASPSSEPPALRAESEYEQREDGELRLLAESDFAGQVAPYTDVLLEGRAHSARGPVVELDTGLAIGDIRKRVRVTGDRCVTLRAGGTLGETAPAPFADMPLDWERAYGGRDVAAERLLYGKKPRGVDLLKMSQRELEAAAAISYPRNRLGRGFFIDVERERLDGQPLPNLSDPDDPVTPERIVARDAYDWVSRPAAASYGPIDPMTFPRCMFHAIRPEMRGVEPRMELAAGALSRDDLRPRSMDSAPNPRYFNCAAPGLAIRSLRGDERLMLWNLHARHERLECDLPADYPTLAVEPPGFARQALAARLTTVLIEPEHDRVTLTWAGAMRVAAVFPPEMCGEMRRSVRWSR